MIAKVSFWKISDITNFK